MAGKSSDPINSNGEKGGRRDSCGGPKLLGKMQLPLHLRGDKWLFGGKKGPILEDCLRTKK
jgi:hypothetical protein